MALLRNKVVHVVCFLLNSIVFLSSILDENVSKMVTCRVRGQGSERSPNCGEPTFESHMALSAWWWQEIPSRGRPCSSAYLFSCPGALRIWQKAEEAKMGKINCLLYVYLLSYPLGTLMFIVYLTFFFSLNPHDIRYVFPIEGLGLRDMKDFLKVA